MKRRGFLAILVAITVMSQSVSADILSQSRGSNVERAVVVVDGRERVVAPGDAIAQGRRVDTEVDSQVRSEERRDQGSIVECEFPKTKYGLEGTGVGSAAIRIEITDDCQMVVASIDEDVAVPERHSAQAWGDLGQGRDDGASVVLAADVRRQTGG